MLNQTGFLKIVIAAAHDISRDSERIRQRALAWQQTADGHRAGADQISELIGDLPRHRFNTLPVNTNLKSHAIVLLKFLWGRILVSTRSRVNEVSVLIHT